MRARLEPNAQFSVDDFESVKTTPWEGVRNAEARNLMKEMKVGDKVRAGVLLCQGCCQVWLNPRRCCSTTQTARVQVRPGDFYLT